MRFFLTGGTGLVGSHTAQRLRERGHEVVALVRPESDTRFLEGLDVRFEVGDLKAGGEALAKALAGCDAVVHSAALVYRRAPWPVYRAANVEATERLLRAAAAAGVARVVHVSSVAVYRGTPRGTPITEDRWREGAIPAYDFYSRSKREAEEVAWSLHARGEIRLTTVRPSIIYGERDRLFTPQLARLASLPVIPLIGNGRSTIAVVYAGNVAAGIVTALEREGTVGRAYNLSMDRPLTARGLVKGFARALGRQPRVIAIPAAAARALATAGDIALGALPRRGRPELRRAVDLMRLGNPYDAGLARVELDWTELVEHEEALRRTADWYRHRRSG